MAGIDSSDGIRRIMEYIKHNEERVTHSAVQGVSFFDVMAGQVTSLMDSMAETVNGFCSETITKLSDQKRKSLANETCQTISRRENVKIPTRKALVESEGETVVVAIPKQKIDATKSKTNINIQLELQLPNVKNYNQDVSRKKITVRESSTSTPSSSRGGNIVTLHYQGAGAVRDKVDDTKAQDVRVDKVAESGRKDLIPKKVNDGATLLKVVTNGHKDNVSANVRLVKDTKAQAVRVNKEAESGKRDLVDKVNNAEKLLKEEITNGHKDTVSANVRQPISESELRQMLEIEEKKMGEISAALSKKNTLACQEALRFFQRRMLKKRNEAVTVFRRGQRKRSDKQRREKRRGSEKNSQIGEQTVVEREQTRRKRSRRSSKRRSRNYVDHISGSTERIRSSGSTMNDRKHNMSKSKTPTRESTPQVLMSINEEMRKKTKSSTSLITLEELLDFYQYSDVNFPGNKAPY